MKAASLNSTENSLLAKVIAQGIPLFLDADIVKASPGNASPYLIGGDEFTSIFSGSERRKCLIVALRTLITSMRSEFEIHAIMIGGSMLDLQEPSPGDLDAVVFYAPTAAVPPADIARRLSDHMSAGRTENLDLRFVPTDASPHILIKAACFFAMLYSSEREQVDMRKGVLLIAGSEI